MLLCGFQYCILLLVVAVLLIVAGVMGIIIKTAVRIAICFYHDIVNISAIWERMLSMCSLLEINLTALLQFVHYQIICMSCTE